MPPTRTKDSLSVNWVADGEESETQPKNLRDAASYNQMLIVLEYLFDLTRGNNNQSNTAKYFSSPAFQRANPGFPKVCREHVALVPCN
jgi:hypothetical protein